MTDRIPTTCRCCGCARFSPSTGCKMCGYGTEHEDKRLSKLPFPKNVEERDKLFTLLVRYAIKTGDVGGTVRALATGFATEGAEVYRDVTAEWGKL